MRFKRLFALTGALLFAAVLPVLAVISAADSGSSTTAGQSSAVIVTGTPTPNSFTRPVIETNNSFLGVQITGTWVATLKPEISQDNGVTWSPVLCNIVGTATTTYVNSITGNGIFSCPLYGAKTFRIRASAYTSGTPVLRFTNAFN